MSAGRSPEPSVLALPVKCLVCGKLFYLPAAKSIATLEQDDPALRRFGLDVSKHAASHRKIVDSISALKQQLDSYLVLRMFEIPEEHQLFIARDIMRHQLHALTRRFAIADEKVFERVASLSLLNPADQEKVYALVLELRDLYEECGLHSGGLEPATPAGRPV